MMQPHDAFPAVNESAVLIRNLRNGAEMQFNCTPKQYLDGMKAYNEGALMQEAFPFLSTDEREFLISGFTPAMWERTFGSGE